MCTKRKDTVLDLRISLIIWGGGEEGEKWGRFGSCWLPWLGHSLENCMLAVQLEISPHCIRNFPVGLQRLTWSCEVFVFSSK